MKDVRLKVFRDALEGLAESLDAVVRVSRWSDADPPPEPLRVAASKLVDRIGTAARLCAGTFVGTPADTVKVNVMVAAMKKLDAAYVAYRKLTEATQPSPDAIGSLEADIAEATAGVL